MCSPSHEAESRIAANMCGSLTFDRLLSHAREGGWKEVGDADLETSTPITRGPVTKPAA